MRVIVLAALLAAVSCSGEQAREPTALSFEETSSPISTRYFPAGALFSRPDMDARKRQWYGYQLIALREASLSNPLPPEGCQTVRFLWLRTFDHPVAIRVSQQRDGSARLVVKMASGAGGYDPGALVLNRSRNLTPEELRAFLAAFEDASFWSLSNDEKVGFDGSHWILEGATHDRYHIVDWRSPSSGAIRDVGLKLIALAGLQSETVY